MSAPPQSTPSSPPSEAGLLRKPLGWIVLAVCAVILCSRKPDAFTTPQFWAEDGYFFQYNVVYGLRAFLIPYNGYLHFVPRLIAALSGLFDYAWIPTSFVCCCLIFTLYVAGLALSERFPLRPALCCALAVVLVPDIPDGLFTPTNLQSILAGGFLALLLFRDPRTPLEYLHDSLALVALSLTGPFSVMLSPLFLIRAYLRRTKASLLAAAIVAIGGAIQLIMIVTHPLPASVEVRPIQWSYVLAVPGSRILASLFWTRYPTPETVLGLLTGFGVATIPGVIWLAWKKKDLRVERAFLAFSVFALLASAVYRISSDLPGLSRIGFGSRYFYAPQLAVLWLLIQAQHDGTRLRWGYRGLLVWFLIMNGPRLREPVLADKHWENYVGALRKGKAVVIPLNPDGWTIDMAGRRTR